MLEYHGDTRCKSASKLSRDFREAPEGVHDASDIACISGRRDVFNSVITATCHWFSNCTIGSEEKVFRGQVKSRTISISWQLGPTACGCFQPQHQPTSCFRVGGFGRGPILSANERLTHSQRRDGPIRADPMALAGACRVNSRFQVRRIVDMRQVVNGGVQ